MRNIFISPLYIYQIANISEELAEFIGITIGDGYFDKVRNRIIITGNIRKDQDYLRIHVKSLINSLFQLEPCFWQQEKKGAVYLGLHSKAVIENLQQYDLCKDEVPQVILRGSSKIKSAFIRGLGDTDFSVSFQRNGTYPTIGTTFSSKKLVKQLQQMLGEFGIKANLYFMKRNLYGKIRDQNEIQIFGRKNLELWLQHIGFKNKRNLSRIENWRKASF